MAEKKQSNLLDLDILRENSDQNHILSVKDIQALLETRYGLNLERRTIYSNLEILAQQGYEISDFKDNGKGYYLVNRQFDKGEVLLLCNAVHASHFISQKQSKKLIDTLLATQSKYDQKDFYAKTYMPNPQKTENRQLMYNVEIVSDAIRDRKMLQFTYLKYGKNKKLVARRPEAYIVEPRYIVYADSRAYMVVTSPNHEGFIHYRLDRIADATIMEKNARKLPKDIDAYEYARNKLFMYSGDMEYVVFKCDEKILDQVIDIFGSDTNIDFVNDNEFTTRVKTSRTGALYLAQQFMEYIEIIEPVSLRDEFKQHLKDAAKKYK